MKQSRCLRLVTAKLSCGSQATCRARFDNGLVEVPVGDHALLNMVNWYFVACDWLSWQLLTTVRTSPPMPQPMHCRLWATTAQSGGPLWQPRDCLSYTLLSTDEIVGGPMLSTASRQSDHSLDFHLVSKSAILRENSRALQCVCNQRHAEVCCTNLHNCCVCRS